MGQRVRGSQEAQAWRIMWRKMWRVPWSRCDVASTTMVHAWVKLNK